MKFWPNAVLGGKNQLISLCFEEVVTSAKCTLDLVVFSAKELKLRQRIDNLILFRNFELSIILKLKS